VSKPIHGPRAPRRALALVTAALLAATGLSTVPAASAADGDALQPVQARDTGLRSGRYVVLMKAPSATQYDGSDPRYAATRMLPGGSFDGRSRQVQSYSRHLVSEHDALARSVGADVLRHYTVGSNGFVADLTGKQAFQLSSDRDVLLVSPDVARQADTWNTPSFLGLEGKNGVWAQQAGGRANAGDGVVVGVIDSGIWPESKSFSGGKLTKRPKTKWKITRVGQNVRMQKADGGVFLGRCQLDHQTEAGPRKARKWNASDCSTKLIGARYYPNTFLETVAPSDRSPDEVLSTRDGDGHGTHTASTSAGNPVAGVKTEDVRFGEVSGMAPAAKVAAYKVCFDDDDEDTGDCFTSSILEAIDDAVADGVDVINFSISGVTDTVIDPVEIAFEGAAEAGIFVATSAGNAGPGASTVAHNSPWLTTVAASTHHNFENTVVLGNGKRIRGASISQQKLPQTRLISSTRAAAGDADGDAATLCFLGSLDPDKVDGKIVVCERGVNDRVEKSKAVKRAGGVGMILANVTPGSLDADFHSVPTIHVSDEDSPKIYRYLARKGGKATAAFKLGDVTGKRPTPVPQIAGFSSRGPALANESDLLKPDITGPGVSVLAAVSPPSNEGRDYDLYSGTSMASPHIAGLAAFMMGERTGWTPMQVKSAMMTSASSLRGAHGGTAANPFAQGAGHVEIRRAFDPGLFVTSGTADWRGFLAGQGLPTGAEPIAAKDFNGPSMAQGQVTSTTSFTRDFIADRAGTWKVKVKLKGFEAKSKKTVVSRGQGDRTSLTLRLTRTTAPLGRWATGFLVLDGPTRVRLPIAVRPVSVRAPAEVSGTGVTGQVDVPIVAGFTGNLDVGVTGLAKAQSFNGTSTNITPGFDDTQYFCVQVAGGSKAARFSLDAANNAADMDLFVYTAADAACEQLTDVAGQSATGSADEQITLEAPEPGYYLVEVDPYTAAPGEPTLSWRLDFYDVSPANQAGAFQAVPDPVPVTNNRQTSFAATWSGLAASSRYLGVLEYAGALAPTYVSVDTATTP
jgi:hypothetical protein